MEKKFLIESLTCNNKMKEKNLIFVYNKKEDKFLLLPLVKKNNHFSQRGCFAIVEKIKNNKYTKELIKKKIGLDIEDIFPLKWGSTYKLKKEEFKEMIFIAFVKLNNLDEKHSKFKWLKINEFTKKVQWKDNRVLLKKVLEKGVNKELYFDKKERGQ